MLPTCVYGYYIRNGKTSHVNAKHRDVTDPTDDMTPRLLITLVFILGIVIAVISTLLLRYIGALSTDPTGELQLACLLLDERFYTFCCLPFLAARRIKISLSSCSHFSRHIV